MFNDGESWPVALKNLRTFVFFGNRTRLCHLESSADDRKRKLGHTAERYRVLAFGTSLRLQRVQGSWPVRRQRNSGENEARSNSGRGLA